MKNSARKGLFHPDDIKTVGLNASPAPLSAPLPNLAKKPSRPALATVNGAQRSVSSGAGSFGRADAKKAQSTGDLEKFDKYAEEDDEDYEDVFGKPNGTSKSECRMLEYFWGR